jgi:8-oxo-dGTP pyrophosphatase MutT (NUDIX family)
MKKLIFYILKMYWKIFRPRTFGVKVVIKHPELPDCFLLVRHSYGNQAKWNLPGGGYNPQRETPYQAAEREVKEELHVPLINPVIIGEHYSELQGKRDTISILSGSINDVSSLCLSDEVVEFSWLRFSEVSNNPNVAKIVKVAVGLYK